MTKPGNNRHYKIHEKPLEEPTFFGASRTCLTNLLMSLILKLLEVCIFIQEQAMDLIKIWYLIEHRANAVFYLKS